MLGTQSNPVKLKILLIGSSFVGKSTILERFICDRFDEDIEPTIGVDFKVKNIVLNGTSVSLKLWDTAGSERFQSLTPSYYRNAHGVILVYDVTRQQTFDDLKRWLDECNQHLDPRQCVKIVVGNKIDLKDERVVHRNQGVDFARHHSMIFVESSAKTSEGINMAFEELVLKIIDQPHLYADQTQITNTNLIAEPRQGIWAYTGCCF